MNRNTNQNNEESKMTYPKNFQTLFEKMIYLLHKRGPICRQQMDVPGYKYQTQLQMRWKITSRGYVNEKNKLLTLSSKGLNTLVEIEKKDLLLFSKPKILKLFRGEAELTVKQVLADLGGTRNPTNMNKIRGRLKNLVANGELMICGKSSSRQLLYSKSDWKALKIKRESAATQLLKLNAERVKKLAIMRQFQQALPGTMTGALGDPYGEIRRQKMY